MDVKETYKPAIAALVVIVVALFCVQCNRVSQAQVPAPADNQFTAEKVALGRMLFFDPRLGADNTIACATCHVPERGWTDNRNVSLGIRNQRGTRNAPTIINVGNQVNQFWDGKAVFLEGQAPNPLENPVEHGNRRAEDVTNKLNRTTYRLLFDQVFGPARLQTGQLVNVGATVPRLSAALATFQRTITVDDAPLDRYLDGETWALSAQQKRGLNVFNSMGCANCHNGKDLRDDNFHNTGITVRFGENDQGRFNVAERFTSKNDLDRRKFKTPTLRQLRDTGPYFHNGRAFTLEDVVAHYNRGGANDQGQVDPLIDPRIVAMRGRMSLQDQADLVAFLRDATAGTVPMVTAPRLPP